MVAWTSCSPDFGVDGVIDRLGQVAPKVLFAADGYVYGGKRFDSLERVRGIAQKLPSLQRIVLVPYLTPAPAIAGESRAIALPDYVAAHRADPIAFDAAYCRDLGYHAVRFLAGGGSGAMITVQDGRAVPIPFAAMRTAEGRTRVRNVDIGSDGYRVAREYMLRLEPDDFRDPAWVERMAEAGGTTADELRARFAGPGGATGAAGS